jgi:hypothetical protein
MLKDEIVSENDWEEGSDAPRKLTRNEIETHGAQGEEVER